MYKIQTKDKIDKVIFYNHYGTGDLHASREFVKDIKKYFLRENSSCNFYYAHSHSNDILFDLFTEKVSFSELCDMRKGETLFNSTLYINTWIGYAWGKYVLPGVACTLENYRRMFNDSLGKYGYYALMPIENYIPSVDYEKMDENSFTNICDFVFEQHASDDNILISNGNVWSNQAENFDFRPIIEELAHKNINKKFIATEKFQTSTPNIYFTEDIIKKSGCDLNEIGYLASFCSVIIGRSSGPYVFTQQSNIYKDTNKKILSFTNNKLGAHMVENSIGAKLYWSNDYSFNGVLNKIQRIINE